MRVRGREHLGGEFDSILTCVSRWRVAVRDCLGAGLSWSSLYLKTQ